jgi:hypothetical protein
MTGSIKPIFQNVGITEISQIFPITLQHHSKYISLATNNHSYNSKGAAEHSVALEVMPRVMVCDTGSQNQQCLCLRRPTAIYQTIPDQPLFSLNTLLVTRLPQCNKELCPWQHSAKEPIRDTGLTANDCECMWISVKSVSNWYSLCSHDHVTVW